MAKNGGARPGAGRKSKIQELDLIQGMDAYLEPYEWAERLYNLIDSSAEKEKSVSLQGLKLWADYRFGKPKQSIDHTSKGEKIDINPISWVDEDKD